jgi:hypothetical protein
MASEEQARPRGPTRATRDSIATKPLPEARAALPYRRSFDAGEIERLTVGLLPRQMEDKWLIYREGEWLHFHRSWTGICIYAVRLAALDVGSAVSEAWVNRDPEQYKVVDERYDTEILGYLVERLLLGRQVPFPGDRVDAALKQRVVGHARANDED